MSIDQKTRIRLRKEMVEILDEFVRICEENNLVYFLIGGTLLGAVRHKGFIPWDDDIDVGMPRNDYEKFLDLFENNTDENYYVLSYRYTFNTFFQYKFSKMCKKGTVYAESPKNPRDYSGIFIDIFPYDNCIPQFSPIQARLIAFSDKLYHLKTNAYITQNTTKRFFRNFICGLLPLRFFKSFLKETYSFFNRFKTQYVTYFSSGYDYKKETQKYSTLFPLTTVCFEGKYYRAPGKWDIFLRTLHGNYMELPPVEQRITHNIKYVLFNDESINEQYPPPPPLPRLIL
jgi:lipopolysaccharide cholinephosphotransferase